MKNAYYCKTKKNVYNRQDVEIFNDPDRYSKLVEKISIKSSAQRKRSNVVLAKFNYLRFLILEKA